MTVWGIFFMFDDNSEAIVAWASSEEAARKGAEKEIARMHGRRPANMIPRYRVDKIPCWDKS